MREGEPGLLPRSTANVGHDETKPHRLILVAPYPHPQSGIETYFCRHIRTYGMHNKTRSGKALHTLTLNPPSSSRSKSTVTEPVSASYFHW